MPVILAVGDYCGRRFFFCLLCIGTGLAGFRSGRERFFAATVPNALSIFEVTEF